MSKLFEILIVIVNLFFSCDIQLDIGGPTSAPPPAPAPSNPMGGGGLLGDIFGLSASGTLYQAPKTIWLPAVKGKGLEISGTFTRRNGQIYMDMTFTNKAMQPMSGFAIQFNKNFNFIYVY